MSGMWAYPFRCLGRPMELTNYVSCNDPSMEIVGTEFVEIDDMLWVVFEYATVSQTEERGK